MPVGEVTYNFGIPAKDKAEAIHKLVIALTTITDELKAMAKLGPN